MKVAAIQMPVPIINSRADIDKQVKEIVGYYMENEKLSGLCRKRRWSILAGNV